MRVGLAERTECFGKGGMAGAVSLLAECESMKSRAGSGGCKGCFVGFAARPSLLQHKLMLCSSPLLRCDEAHNNFSHGDGL